MVSISILMFTVIFLVTAECAKAEETSDTLKTLKMVHMLFRHGDRAPVRLYPNDPVKNVSSKVWPEGLGQLTKIGKAMEYEFGLWLRKRYDGFIKRVFDTEEMYVRSTDFDRTLMSAECLMAAFYRPDDGDDDDDDDSNDDDEENNEFRENLPWLPTPIHTSPSGYDKLLTVGAACPRVASETSKLQEIPEIQDFNEKNKELFKFISDKSGAKMNTVGDMLLLYDTIRIERLYNLTVPSWAVESYNEMKTVGDFFYEMHSYSRELKRLRGGPLLKTITENMRNKSQGHLQKKKMLVYSGHDTTVTTLLNSMGVYDHIPSPYGAAVMIELHQINKEFFVKMYYQNDTTLVNSPHELILPGCSQKCPLSDFISLLKDVIPEDWEKECQIKETLEANSDHTGNSSRGEEDIQVEVSTQSESSIQIVY